MQGQVPSDMEISASLQAQEWQIVMDTLSDGRFRLVAPIIQKLAQQFDQATQQSTAPAYVGNGATPAARPTMPVGDGV